MGKDYRYNIKLNPNKPEHLKVAQIFDSLGRGEIRQFIVNAVLSYSMNDAGQNSGKGIDISALHDTIKSMVDSAVEERLRDLKQPLADKIAAKTPKHDKSFSEPQPQSQGQVQEKNSFSDIMGSLNEFL